MEKNEVKKSLYRENPKAWLVNITKDGILYRTDIWKDSEVTRVSFLIPGTDIQDAKFNLEMPAKHLIRWLQE